MLQALLADAGARKEGSKTRGGMSLLCMPIRVAHSVLRVQCEGGPRLGKPEERGGVGATISADLVIVQLSTTLWPLSLLWPCSDVIKPIHHTLVHCSILA